MGFRKDIIFVEALPIIVLSGRQFWLSILLQIPTILKSKDDIKVWHPRCVRSIIQSSSVYIYLYIYIYSHETQQLL